MGAGDSWWKQFAAKGNKNSIISLFIVGTAISLLIFFSIFPFSNEGETVQNATLKVDFSFPLQNSYERELNHGVEKKTNISVEVLQKHPLTEGDHGSSNIRKAEDKNEEHGNGVQLMAPIEHPQNFTDRKIEAPQVVVESQVRSEGYTHELDVSSSGSVIKKPKRPSSNEGEIAQNTTLKVDFSFLLQNSSEPELNHGVEKKTNISVEVLQNNPLTEGDHGSKNERKSEDKSEEHGNGVPLMTPLEHPQNFTDRKIDAPLVVAESQVRSEGSTHKLDVSSSRRVIKRPRRPSSKCDIYSGRWVRDELYPLYPAGECPYINQAFNCKRNGRQDSNYTKWRWQPFRCHLPRLNAMDMLERLRGKRLMFVGDSINHNQWESLICILRTAIPDQNRIYFGPSKDGATSFLAKDYNCSVDFFWAPFLVEQGQMDVGTKSKEILKLDAIENNGAHWKNVDILVFNTGHWWTHGNKVESRDFYMEGNTLYAELEPLDAFKKGFTTWAKWVDKNLDPTKTKVFFRGFSPMHFSSSQWNKPRGHRCNFETFPIFHSSYISPYPERMRMVEEVVGQIKFPINLMNITRLSDYRKDAHPSVYTARNNKKLTAEEMNDPDKYGDCSHWCLPGLPDIWNELLYGSLVLMESSPVAHSH